mgnify:CR=1 FL=1
MMPEFQYIALARDGKETHGREFADNAEVLKQLLKKRRLILVKAKPRSQKRIAPASVGKLINDLADLLDSGVVLDRALQEARRNKAEKLVDGYSMKAVIGALAALTPGTDLLIQGWLGTQLIRELGELYEIPVREVDSELRHLLEVLQAGHGST